MDDESVDELIAYARRTDPYVPGTAETPADLARPYVRSLPEVEAPDGWIDLYEVAVRRPGSPALAEREATSRPEEALRRLGLSERDARDCVQNAWLAGRGRLSSWYGVRPEDVRSEP